MIPLKPTIMRKQNLGGRERISRKPVNRFNINRKKICQRLIVCADKFVNGVVLIDPVNIGSPQQLRSAQESTQ
jgi:hypothetical protein